MATKIFYNGNRIIIDGHADTAEECQAITAMCDSMLQSDDFETVVYEKGHAVFERVRGGESKMFDTLEDRVAALEALIGTLPEGKNTIVGYVDETYALSDSAMNKSNEALITAEAAMAAAKNAEQLAINGLMFAQQADDKVTQLESNIEDAVHRAEDASARAEAAANKSEDKADTVEKALAGLNDKIGILPEGENTVIEYIDKKTNVPTQKLPFTAAELVVKLNSI